LPFYCGPVIANIDVTIITIHYKINYFPFLNCFPPLGLNIKINPKTLKTHRKKVETGKNVGGFFLACFDFLALSLRGCLEKGPL